MIYSFVILKICNNLCTSSKYILFITVCPIGFFFHAVLRRLVIICLFIKSCFWVPEDSNKNRTLNRTVVRKTL